MHAFSVFCFVCLNAFKSVLENRYGSCLLNLVGVIETLATVNLFDGNKNCGRFSVTLGE